MGESVEKNKLSRRDFLKIGGIAGLAAQAVSLPIRAYQAGADKEILTGWESMQAENTQFFNRKPFELSGIDELYEKYHPNTTEPKKRPDKYSEMAFNRVMQMSALVQMVAIKEGYLEEPPPEMMSPMGGPVIPKVELTDDVLKALRKPVYDAIPDPYFQDHYVYWEEHGQDRLVEDIRTILIRSPKLALAKKQFSVHLAMFNAFSNAYDSINGFPDEPAAPPEVSDYTLSQITFPGFPPTVTDIREITPATGMPGKMEFKSPKHAADLIKRAAHMFGATLVGITTMNPDFCYSRSVRGSQAAPMTPPSNDAGPTAGFLSDEEKTGIAAALDGTDFDAEQVIGILEESGGEQAKIMSGVMAAGIDGMALIDAMTAAGIDPMSLGQGSADAEPSQGSGAPFMSFMFKGDLKEYEVPKHWKYVIVVGVPHDWDEILGSPQVSQSMIPYTRVRLVTGRIETLLKQLGYAARHQSPGFDYDMLMPPFAVQAGLGQWGRHSCVITPETGANLRLGAIVTDLEMEIDKPIDIGVAEFCKDCKICAELCPTGAISFADSPENMGAHGYERWVINTSKCYGMWQTAIGSGCRLCIASCPYSRKDNWVHGLVREWDPIDPTGVFNDGLIWMQKNFFKAPANNEYLAPPDGCYATYRPAADFMTTEAWFTNETVKPADLCK